jgi:hypothetical protein
MPQRHQDSKKHKQDSTQRHGGRREKLHRKIKWDCNIGNRFKTSVYSIFILLSIE